MTQCFSKVLFPGLRVGWICANKTCINQLTRLKELTEISGNQFTQAAIFLYCQSGKYETHKRRFHKIYKKRMILALKLLKEQMPTWVKFTRPMGGYAIWLELNKCNVPEKELINKFTAQRILLNPGSDFYLSPSSSINFRISIAHTNESEIRRGIQTISNILYSINHE